VTWVYANKDDHLEARAITLAGKRVGYCKGYNVAESKALVLICRIEGAGIRPVPMIVDDGTVEARVKANFSYLLEGEAGPNGSLLPDQSFAYLTLTGWVDHRSSPLLEPHEIEAD